MTDFYVDGEKFDMDRLIKLAESAGYEELSGLYLTSRAVSFLRRGGWHVSDKPCAFNHPDEPCNADCQKSESK